MMAPADKADVEASGLSGASLMHRPDRASLLRQSFIRAASLTGTIHTPFELPLADPYDEQHFQLSPDAGGSFIISGEPVEESPRTLHDAAEETNKLLYLALPLMVQAMSSMLLNIIITVAVGHLNSAIELSAVVLANSVYNVTGYSLILGISSAMDTFCGQAYGAKNYRMLGVMLQRAQAILWVLCVPIVVLWTQMDKLLPLLGQDPELVRLTARMLRIMAPGLFFTVVSDTTRRYLLAQRIVRPGMVCYLITVALSPLLNWLLIYELGWRTDGAAAAFAICQVLLSTQLALYRMYRDSYVMKGKREQTWHGWSLRSAFQGWGAYLAMGLLAAAMICFEWWVWEAMIIMAGVLPTATTSVAVMGICMQISSFAYMIPVSFGSAAAVRVSNLLGGGYARSARMAAWLSLATIAAVLAVVAGVVFVAKDLVVTVFTDEPTVTATAKDIMPALIGSLSGDGLVAVLSGVLRGCGRQGIGAALNLAGYWCIGMPLAYVLGFRVGLEVKGFWIALATANLIQAAVFTTVIALTNWSVEVKRAGQLSGSKSIQQEAYEELLGDVGDEGLDGAPHTQPLLGSHS